jgi:hypothetical protein
MIKNLNEIVNEWAYRVDNGQPNPNNSTHLYHLSEILIEYKWPFEVIDELLENLNEVDIVQKKQSDGSYGSPYTVKNHNPDRGQKLVKKNASKDDIEKVDTGEEPKDKKPKLKTKMKREDIDSIDGKTKTKALNKEEKAPGNESSVINEIGVGIGMTHISDNPDISVRELEDKLFNEIMNTKIGKSNGDKATRNACRAAAKSAKREHKRTQNTIEKNGMNSETTKVSHVWGSKTSLENTVKLLEEQGVIEVNGIPVEDTLDKDGNVIKKGYKTIILEGGAGKNPTDTMVVMIDDSVKPPKVVINHTSNKTSSDDIQGNSGPDKNADYVMNKADEDLKSGKITEEEWKHITETMTRLREDFINAQNQIEELINEQFSRMESDIEDPKKRKKLIEKTKKLSTSKPPKGPGAKWELLAKRYGDVKGREFDYNTGTYKPPLSEEEETKIITDYYNEMESLATSDESASVPPKTIQQIMARKDMYPPPEEELNDLYRVQHSLISETRKRVDKIKPGYGTEAAAQNIFERLHLDVVQGHNPGGIPRENFEVNMGNNDSGRKYDKDGNVYHHIGQGRYQRVNPKTGQPEGEKIKPKQGELSSGDSAVVVNSETIAKALGIKPPAKDITSKIRVSEVKSGKGKTGTATIYGINAEGQEIIIGYQDIRPKDGPGSKHQDTIRFHPDFQKRLMKATEEVEG